MLLAQPNTTIYRPPASSRAPPPSIQVSRVYPGSARAQIFGSPVKHVPSHTSFAQTAPTLRHSGSFVAPASSTPATPAFARPTTLNNRFLSQSPPPFANTGFPVTRRPGPGRGDTSPSKRLWEEQRAESMSPRTPVPNSIRKAASPYVHPTQSLTRISPVKQPMMTRRRSLGAITEISTDTSLRNGTGSLSQSLSSLGTVELPLSPVAKPATSAFMTSSSSELPATFVQYVSSDTNDLKVEQNNGPKVKIVSPDADDEMPMMGKTSTMGGYGGTRAIVGTNAFKIGTIQLKLMPESDRSLALRITSLLESRDELKMGVIRCFTSASKGCEKTELDLEQLQAFRNLLPGALDVPPDTFDDLCSDYVRFDFSGSGRIGMNAAYKLVKFHLRDHHKRLAAAPATANVPVKDVKTAGYTVEGDLGQGNQGTAKLVSKRGKKRCMKCYDKSRMSASGVEELRQEFEALKLLQCENIASVIEIFQDQNFYYLVGEAYHGGDFMTLKEKAVQQGVACEDWFRGVFNQCFEALVFMHEQAMMHCDIKEPNLMLRDASFRNPRVVVIDLGVCACMASSDNGMPHGTPGYVPPETLKTRKWFPRGDVFSMGVCICQIICDKLPPTGFRDRNTPGGIFIEGCMNMREIFLATRTREPPLHLMPAEYPLLLPLVQKLLEKKRDKRPSAPMVLNEEWFKQGREAEATWRFADMYDSFKARSRFASVGITDAFVRDQFEEYEDMEDTEEPMSAHAKRNLDALRAATEIISSTNSPTPKD